MTLTTDAPLSLSDHKRVEMSLLTDLEKLKDYAEQLQLDRSREALTEVTQRLKSSRFSLAVVGEFKRGKSTFINALLGKDILPSDLLPCSATLNRVTYGLEPHVEVFFKDGSTERVAIDQLANYVTKLDPDAEEMAARVREAVVHYPVAYCQNNVDIIDTPGLNDDSSMTDVTLSVLPTVDAAILVVMAMSPFSEYERDFLENKLLTSDLGRVLFVVSAIDRLNSPEDADKVVKAVRDRIKKYVVKRAEEQFGAGSAELQAYLNKIGEPKVFGLSAYQALQAREKGDAALAERSRFNSFEKELERFLAQERGAVTLQIPLTRAVQACGEIRRALDIKEKSLGMETEEFAAAFEQAQNEIAEMRARRQAEENKIDQASVRLRNEILPKVASLSDKLESTVRDTINAYPLTAEDTRPPKVQRVVKELTKQITAAVQKGSQQHAEDIQLQIQQALMVEADRLSEFVQKMGESVQNIHARFTEGDPTNTDTGDMVCAGLALFTGLGGVWSGYKEAGVKGAALGGAVSLGTVMGGAMFLGMLGVTVISLPISLGLLAASFFTGGWVTKNLFGQEQLQKFRDEFFKQTWDQIESKLNVNTVEREVGDYINETFAALKTKVQTETAGLLDDTDKTLRGLQAQRERAQALSEEERKDFGLIRERLNQIEERSNTLLQQLRQISGTTMEAEQ
jgi:hypothetical protein